MPTEDLFQKLAARERGKVVGLTGLIATGKSNVSEMLAEKGLEVIDFDRVTRVVRDWPEVQKKILDRFGTTDRMELRKIIFADAEAEKALAEFVMEPTLKVALERTLSAFENGQGWVIWDSALLDRYGLLQHIQSLILVNAPVQVIKERLKARDGITDALATQMIDQQILRMDGQEWAKYDKDLMVIENDEGFDKLEKEVVSVLKQLGAE